MRRGYAWILLVSVIGSWTPSAFGQYPYPYAPQPPYGPMPAQYPPPQPYGPMPTQYPPAQPYGPMPAQYLPPQPYGPMPAPGYYPPPMPMQQPPRVFVYGPLTAAPPDPTAPLPGQGMVQPGTAKASPTRAVNPNDKRTNIAQAQLTLPPAGAKDTAPPPQHIQPAPDSCGASCFDEICAPTPIYNFIPQDPVLLGHGHFIAEVGAIAVVPYMNPHSAYTSSTAAGGAATDFPRQADFGPSVSFGYIAHNGWGVRADYWYLHGDINETLANTTPGVNINTPPIGGLQIAGPSQALANGIGTDQYHFAQRLDLQVADIEVVKEQTFLDTTFLFGAGARYVHFQQAYAATRSNPGGFDAFGDAVTMERADFSSISRYEGWGPTLSFELVHPICGSNLSVYANLRASFMWGTESFQQDERLQERFSNFLGATTFRDNQMAAAQLINRQIEVGEAEVGLQYGTRLGHVYVYGRAGVSVQRWFNVGNPTANNGNVEFFGGTAKIGITY